ncbi:MAG: hypothetical protein ACFB02_10615 [Mastigocoleus sp.]
MCQICRVLIGLSESKGKEVQLGSTSEFAASLVKRVSLKKLKDRNNAIS